MKDEIKQLINQSNQETMELSVKGSIGLVGSFTAMSINDWAGLIVAILTGIYMCFQIESAWCNRRNARGQEKKSKE